MEDRDRCVGRMAAVSLWRPGRWRARLGSDVSVSTNKYRAVSALAMLGVERAGCAWRGGGQEAEGAGLGAEVFPPTLVKEDGALPETADCRMDLTVVLRWGHDGPVVVCNPVLR